MSLKSYRRRQMIKSVFRLLGIYTVGVFGAWINGMIILPAMSLTAPSLSRWAAVTAIVAIVSMLVSLLKGDE